MYDAPDVWSQPVNQQVHCELDGDVATTRFALSIKIHNHQIVG